MKYLKAKEVADLMGYSLHYFRNDIASLPDFPKAHRRRNARGGTTQPRYLQIDVHEYMKKAN